MADSKSGVGGFRTHLGGFNKEDVIAYINELQEERARETEALSAQAQGRYAAYEKALEDANAALRDQYGKLRESEAEQDKLQALINEQYAANRQLREQVETLTMDGSEREELERLRRETADSQAQTERLMQENAALQAELEQEAAAAARLQQQLEAANRELEARQQQYQQLEEAARLRQERLEQESDWQQEQLRQQARQQQEQMEQKLSLLREQTDQELSHRQEQMDAVRQENDRYHQLVNGVGGFVVDVRAMGRRYLDNASNRCDARLEALTQMVAAMQEQLTAASADLAEARDALREQSCRDLAQMDAMGDEMMRTATGLEDPEPAGNEEEDVKDIPLPEAPVEEESAPEDPAASETVSEGPVPVEIPPAPDFF